MDLVWGFDRMQLRSLQWGETRHVSPSTGDERDYSN